MSETSSTPSASNERLPAPMQNDMVKKLVYSGVLAGVSAIAAIAARKITEQIWIRVFNEEPPID
ncbi:MAG: hypothetical protein HYX29_09835 [Solirubrobacterales bacterium]|nr:hypothetical protein [Solirubrobacterales bacterium]